MGCTSSKNDLQERWTTTTSKFSRDNIPLNFATIVIINLNHTHSILQRHIQITALSLQLKSTFNHITANSIKSNTISITVIEAFKQSNKQFKPSRNYRKQSILSSNKQTTKVIDQYFVFDHHNKLLSENNQYLCDIFCDDRNIDKNVHFIMQILILMVSVVHH